MRARIIARVIAQKIRAFLLYGILFLFFFQLLSDFIEAIYAFGLLGTSIPPEIAAVLLLFAPLLLLFFREGVSGRVLAVTGELALVCRVVEALLDTRGRMLVSGLGVGLLLVFFPALLWRFARRESPGRAWSLGTGLALGVSISVLLRTINSGLDLSTDPRFQWSGWGLALLAAFLLPGEVELPEGSGAGRTGTAGTTKVVTTSVPTHGTTEAVITSVPASKTTKVVTTSIPARRMVETVTTSSPDRSNSRSNGFSRFLGLSLGLTSVYILLYFAFNSPSVIARWTGANYLLVVALLVLAQAAFAVMLAARPQTLMIPRPAALWAANLLLVLSLLLTILAHQIRFPLDPGGYPLPEPPVSGLAILPLVLTLTLSPTLLWDALLIFQALLASQGGESSQMSGAPSFRSLALAFSLASLYLLVMIFAQVFTTVYDYIPIVGPFFRDKSWLVYLVPGLGLLIGLRAARLSPRPQASFSGAPSFAAVVCLAGLFSLAAALLNSPRPPAPVGKASLRVLTYNIQQGYSAEGQRSYRAQLEVLRQANPDIIGLEESDTARISGGNADLVRYFADRLRLYSYYGPKTVTGTFGIALLSKYPIQNPRTFYMYSTGEQTAVIEAQITAGGKTYNVFVTHLGNGGPLIQQEQVLAEVGQQPDVIAIGDFNFRPSGEQYRRTTARLADAWLLKWPQGADDQGYIPTNRIDHIFVSPGIQVLDARHLLSPASDHPAVVVEITD